MKKDWILGISIALGLIIGGAMIPLAVNTLKAYGRTVDVRGLCEMEVKADKVIWPLSYKVVGDDLTALMVTIERNNELVRQFLLDGGVIDDEISISMPDINDRDASDYSVERSFRYVAKSTVTVCTKNVDTVLALMEHQADLLKQGITFHNDYYGSRAQFSFESLNEIKPKMIEQATANARAAAEKFAADSGSKLGKIMTATQGVFSIEDRDDYTPQIKNVRVVTYVTYYLKN